jgi:bifunctional DNA-binding transcriptional regulator/antitoxin component of YhaV-PrlF toxin-antitoxin module
MAEGSVIVDSKYRVVLEKNVRAVSGIGKGERLTAIPFQGGVILTSARGKRFAGSLDGFKFREESHEADRFLQKLNQENADN